MLKRGCICFRTMDGCPSLGVLQNECYRNSSSTLLAKDRDKMHLKTSRVLMQGKLQDAQLSTHQLCRCPNEAKQTHAVPQVDILVVYRLEVQSQKRCAEMCGENITFASGKKKRVPRQVFSFSRLIAEKFLRLNIATTVVNLPLKKEGPDVHRLYPLFHS